MAIECEAAVHSNQLATLSSPRGGELTVIAGARREPHEYVLIEPAPIMIGQHVGMRDEIRN